MEGKAKINHRDEEKRVWGRITTLEGRGRSRRGRENVCVGGREVDQERRYEQGLEGNRKDNTL